MPTTSSLRGANKCADRLNHVALLGSALLVYAVLADATFLHPVTAPATPQAVRGSEISKRMDEASKLFRQCKWTQTITVYSSVLTASPTNVRARVNRGICYCRINQFNKAISDFNIAIKDDPNSDRAYQHRGYAFYKLGKFQNTIADASKAIKLNSSNRYAFRDRAQAYARLGQFDLAQKDFSEQQKLNRIAHEYYVALDLQHIGKFSDALALFEKNQKENPGMFNPNFRRATIYTKLGMYQEAVDVSTQFIKEHPDTFEGRRLRAINYLQLGELAKARADADKALDIDPHALDPYYVKARASVYAKNYPEAIKNYSQIIKLAPSTELPARMERADAYTAIGDYAKAVSDYDFLVNAEPDDETVYHHRAAVFTKMGSLEKAIADLQTFAKLAPKDPLAFMSLGDGLYQDRRYTEAVAAYTKAIELDPAAPTLLNLRARALEKCNHLEAAQRDRARAKLLQESE
ncbi:MAG: tetratricopeptide repeat protein [Candidatus Melainabacteria bacterium]|nr:MAG: tetratricopeptide repeat protein [Candidatus Melainabacteria bacterium]